MIIDADKVLEESGFKAPSKENLEYQVKLSEAEKLQGQFNLRPIFTSSELEYMAEDQLEEALKQIK